MNTLTRITPGPDVDTAVRMLCQAFAGTPEAIREWLALGDLANLRALRHPDEPANPAAILLQIPMGQFFGGRTIPLLGVAGVAVAPEHRGRGFARSMMHAFVREARDQGFPLAGLYASTHSLYRQIGFEHAGFRFQYRIPFSHIPRHRIPTPVVPLADADMPAVHRAYANFARRFNGPLDRGSYIWSRIRKLRETAYTGFGIPDDSGNLLGYLFLHQGRRPDGRQDIQLSDFVFLSLPAGQRLLTFLADFAMMAEDLTFFGGPEHPALSLLPQQRHEVLLKDTWFLRVLDPAAALAARGYSAALDAELHLHVTDDAIPENSGPYVLRVRRGDADVSRGGRGDLRCSSNGLAALFSSFASPHQASLAGWCQGPPDALDLAAGLFAGTPPWMSDMY